MAALTLYVKNAAAAGSSHGSLQDGGTPPGTATTGTGWTVAKTATANYSLMVFGTKRAASTFAATAQPAGAPSTTDCFRSENTYYGSFAAGNWVVKLSCISVTAAATGSGRFRVRIWRSTSATGSGATEITAGANTTTSWSSLTTSTAQNLSVTISLGAVTLANEYIFVQIAEEIVTASGSTSADCVIRTDSTNSVITTPSFTLNNTGSGSAAMQSFAAGGAGVMAAPVVGGSGGHTAAYASKTPATAGVATSVVIADPGVAGAFALCIVSADITGTISPPDATWKQLQTGQMTLNGQTVTVWKKYSMPGSGTYTFTIGSAADISAILAVYTGVVDVDDSGINIDLSFSLNEPWPMVAPSVSPTRSTDLLVWLGALDLEAATGSADTFVAPTGYTSRGLASNNPGWSAVFLADKLLSASGATGTATGTDTRANGFRAQTIGVHVALFAEGGAPALAAFAVSGSGTLGGDVTGSGSAAEQSFAVSGSGTEIFAGSGTAAEQRFAASGVGAEIFAGSGTAAEQSFAVSGVGAEVFAGSGSAAEQPFAVSGVGTEIFAGSGTAAGQPFAASGVGAEIFAGSGTAAEQSFACAATGAEQFTCAGSSAAAPFASTGTGVTGTDLSGSGSAAASPIAAAGSGVEAYAGSGASAAAACAAVGNGVETYACSGSGALSRVDVTGAGTQRLDISGTAAVSAAPFAAAGTGVIDIVLVGAAVVSCAAFNAFAAGSETFEGAATASREGFLAAGLGGEVFAGHGAAAVQVIRARGKGVLVLVRTPNLHPTDIRYPSVERQPFTNSGERKPGGPGPYLEDRFYDAPDLDRFPQWRRTRGNEWTTAEFRKLVLTWLRKLFAARPWLRAWDIEELASAPRSGRLTAGEWYLRIGVTQVGGKRFETAAQFPPAVREDPARALAVLAQAAQVFDVLHAQR